MHFFLHSSNNDFLEGVPFSDKIINAENKSKMSERVLKIEKEMHFTNGVCWSRSPHPKISFTEERMNVKLECMRLQEPLWKLCLVLPTPFDYSLRPWIRRHGWWTRLFVSSTCAHLLVSCDISWYSTRYLDVLMLMKKLVVSSSCAYLLMPMGNQRELPGAPSISCQTPHPLLFKGSCDDIHCLSSWILSSSQRACFTETWLLSKLIYDIIWHAVPRWALGLMLGLLVSGGVSGGGFASL